MPTSSASTKSNHQTPPPGPPPKVQAYVNPAEPTSQIRTSTSSTKSNSSGRRNINPSQTYPTAQPLSQIEKSVTHLLVATKQLLETLTQWSRQQASDAQVSDVYVRLGYEFNLACRAFAAINVDTSDLGNVPELLRTILESTLSQEASVESLENYLPRIRDIIINLLHGLKRKQQKLRNKQTRDVNGDQSVQRNISADISTSGSITVENPANTDDILRNTEYRSGTPTKNVTTFHNASSSSTRRGQTPRDQVPPVTVKEEIFPPPPPPPPKVSKNAFAALQRGGDLERRASRRYSTYQISKHLGASPSFSQNIDIKANDIKNPSSNNEKQISSTPPPPTKDITLFLQYKTKIKKFSFSGGYKDLSVARLQLAFIEKFAWNTHHNGVDLPEIYIQDPISGIQHELEDLSDVKDRSVLVLNVDALDEAKRHIDDGLGGIKKMIESVKTAVDDQQATIQQVSDRQQDTAKEISRIQSTVSSRSRESYSKIPQNSAIPGLTRANTLAQKEEVQAIRRDLAILRQSYSSYQSDVQNSLNAVRKMAENVKIAAAKACLPDMTSDSGRKYVNDGKKGLDEESDKLVAHVDDLQDTVEDLRKDVVLRGVRPLPRQLEYVSRDIALAGVKIKKMKDLIKREKPIWTKIWEKELERVCKDQEDMTLIEELIIDLEDDLTKASQTFALVEEATKEQLKDPHAPTSAGRAISRGLNQISIGDPTVAKEGVLDEVRALQPNHEDRLEAIERAEKLRARELESRRENEFEKELGNFVEEGKLRKSGGFEEADRARQVKDEKIRIDTWDKKNGTTLPDAVPGLEIADTENIDVINIKKVHEDADEG
ncbi:Bud site selection protein 6 [Erysiphe neolycopersici]|uniref:Bud site selection protein 6 n=1 Tax=Erysiphe neolycopersici TaxID=212602 RepID=A0A420HYI7_9PEZI|nr:Bud site selection protein 6 [Erysiphe neolycopersici]